MANIRIFRDEISDPDEFVITLELVPGAMSRGRAVETVIGMARDAHADGRISAVSITDNPGGNPALSPDVLAHDIFKAGMDVIVHFTCRDLNRVAMESRALQLDLMGIKNILALNGDYSGKGFGGQGAPVFDLDSVSLTCMLNAMSDRLEEAGDPERFFVGCAVSPFKSTEAESFTQYAKLCKKVSAGAEYIITQLGFDARKYQELIQIMHHAGIDVPVMASLYYVSPGAARAMRMGKVPGAVMPAALLKRIQSEWKDKKTGRSAAVERTARLAAVLKGLGYRGIHIGGIHKKFSIVGRILDRMEAIENDWRNFIPEFLFPEKNHFYFFKKDPDIGLSTNQPADNRANFPKRHRWILGIYQWVHDVFFNFDGVLAVPLTGVAKRLDRTRMGRNALHFLETPIKKLLFGCRVCGDCALQHLAFFCPESKCPKHTRNGPCGGSINFRCEVKPEQDCVWVKAYRRLSAAGKTEALTRACVSPRMWELNDTPSWLNYHMKRDHRSASGDIARFCDIPMNTRQPDPRNNETINPHGGDKKPATTNNESPAATKNNVALGNFHIKLRRK